MGDFKLNTIDEFEAATAKLLETAEKVGADTWQLRVKNQTPHCKFGEQGVCCRICSMDVTLQVLWDVTILNSQQVVHLLTLTMVVRSVIHCTAHLRMELTM